MTPGNGGVVTEDKRSGPFVSLEKSVAASYGAVVDQRVYHAMMPSAGKDSPAAARNEDPGR